MKLFILVCAAAAGLAGCSGDDANVLAPACPEIVIVQDLARLTQFKPGDGRDLTDVVLEGTVNNFDGFCETELEKDVPSEVEISLRLVFTMGRGPANADRKGSFRYFAALADRDGNTVRKHVFDSTVEFPGNRNRIAPFEELSLTIPLKQGERGSDYTVYVGFQLTPEQLEYNRTIKVR